MASPGGGGRAASASERAYGALVRLYPEELRRRYGGEMVRCFGELCREETRDRGARGVAALWARTLPELLFTALKERSGMLARNAYLPVRPATAARWGALSALVGGTLGTAFYLVGELVGVVDALIFAAAVLLSALGLVGLYGTLAACSRRPGKLAGAGAVLAILSAASWLVVGGYEGVRELILGPGPVINYFRVVGLIDNVAAVGVLCWFFGLLLLGVATLKSQLPGRLRALPLALFVLTSVSIVVQALFPPAGYGGQLGYGLDNLGLLVLLIVLHKLATVLPFLGSALLGWVLLGSRGTDRPLAAASGAASGAAGGIGPVRRTTSAATGAAGRALGAWPGASAAKAKEKELLEAIRRHGETTAAGAALETSLSVAEADRMLSRLAAKGHLEVRVERGMLVYALWRRET